MIYRQTDRQTNTHRKFKAGTRTDTDRQTHTDTDRQTQTDTSHLSRLHEGNVSGYVTKSGMIARNLEDKTIKKFKAGIRTDTMVYRQTQTDKHN